MKRTIVRRVGALLAAAALLAACWPLGVLAAQEEPLPLRVEVGALSCEEDAVAASITYSHAEGYALKSGSVTVTYDPSALEPVAPRGEDGAADWDLAAGEALTYAVCQGGVTVPGELTLSFVAAGTAIPAEGTLFNLSFRRLSGAAEELTLQAAVGADGIAVRLADDAEVALAASAAAGAALTVGETDALGLLLGDVNRDGEIDTTDARLTLQYAARRLGGDALHLDAAEVNGDGAVDTTDARLILQYAARRIKDFPRGTGGTGEETAPSSTTPTTPAAPTEPTESETGDETQAATTHTATAPVTTAAPTTAATTAASTTTVPTVTYPTFEDTSPDPAVGASPNNVGWAFLALDQVPVKDGAADNNIFSKFMLYQGDNETLPYSIYFYISRSQKAITALLPSGTDLSAMIPRFEYDGTVTLYGREIRSGVDVLDFSQKFQLVLTAPDGRQNTVVVKAMTLETGLPAFTMTTDGLEKVDSKTEYKTAVFTLGGGDAARCFYAGGETVTVTGQAKGRGNTSWGQEKKSYTLKFDSKRKLLDMDSSKDWVLVAGHEDYSLLRNVMGQVLGEMAGVTYTLKARPVDLWYNGAYWGTYTLIQKIEIEGSRVDITKYTAGCAPGATGFLLEFDGHVCEADFEQHRAEYRLNVGDGYEVYYNPGTDELFFPLSIGGKWLTIKKPSYTKYLVNDTAQIRYLYDYVYAAMDALQNGSYADICRYIDVESFTNWYMVEEYMNNCDSSFHSSCYMTLDVGGKLQMGPVWDFDRSSDNCNYWNPENAPDSLYNSGAAWFTYLYRHEEARAVLKTRWQAFYAATADIGGAVDEWGARISDSAAQNFARWSVLGAENDGTRNRAVGSNTELTLTATTWEGQVTILRNYLTNRREAMNAFIQSL